MQNPAINQATMNEAGCKSMRWGFFLIIVYSLYKVGILLRQFYVDAYVRAVGKGIDRYIDCAELRWTNNQKERP